MLALDPTQEMTAQEFVQQLFALPELEAQKQRLLLHRTRLDDQVATLLKQEADQELRADIQRSLRCAELILALAALTAQPLQRALGLLAKGNGLSIGLGEYNEALPIFNEALALYRQAACPVGAARVEIGRMWALACLGRYPEAFASGDHACTILEAHAEWRLLATAKMNLGIIYCRHGEDAEALALYDQAEAIYKRLGPESERYWLLVQQNRAVSLRNVGKFAAAIETCRAIWQKLQRSGQPAEAARAQQNLAMTYYVLGRYNEALENLDQAYTVFWDDGRLRDAMLVELFTSDCLLQLRRFGDVLEKCQRVRRLFAERGARQVVAQAIVNEALAYTNLGRHPEALASLQEAYTIFQEVGNQIWMAMTRLETAAILHSQGDFAESLRIAEATAEIFASHGLLIEQAQAYLVAAQAALARQHDNHAQLLIEKVLHSEPGKEIPALLYRGRQLLGLLAEEQDNAPEALQHYDQAIQALEHMRGRLMVEHRAGFLEDKQIIYEDAVRLCLVLDQPQQALTYAERAKSRALLELVAYRLSLRIQAKRSEDAPLVEELTALRTQRDRLYRRWASNEDLKLRGWTPSETEQTPQQEILALEKQITALWHKLLVHNAEYARDAALWQVRTESVQPYLPPNTTLLEYFSVRNQLIVFVVTPEAVHVQRLDCQMAQVQRLLQLLQVNLNLTPRSNKSQVAQLTLNAQGLLRQLHQALLQPVLDRLGNAQRLIVVPHGSLHYLPFHALYDGQSYLLERYAVSYLPGSSLLRYCVEATLAPAGAVLYGHSWQGKLPDTLREVAMIAEILGEPALVEDDLSAAQLAERMANSRIVHLATHGDFRADNPLFSGLLIGDGWLTTIDIFNMQLRASLVTLSGCQTGRNVVQGGDELAGLMRAFLSAGAASLVLSLWPVEDQATAQLMQLFYSQLAAGETKGEALRSAQLQFIHNQAVGGRSESYAHPYFWAPFFLTGDPGPL